MSNQCPHPSTVYTSIGEQCTVCGVILKNQDFDENEVMFDEENWA